MAGRTSNKDRIARLQAESEAASKEKEKEKAAAKSAPKAAAKREPAAKRQRAPAAVKIVWAVCEASGKQVKHYAYPQESEAIAEAKRRTAATGQTHFVTRAEVPQTQT